MQCIKRLQTMIFSWIPTVISLLFIIYQVTISQAEFDISRLKQICSISSIFSRQSEQRKTVSLMTVLFISLINQVLVIRSFTILHRLGAIMFHASHLRLWRLSLVNYCQSK